MPAAEPAWVERHFGAMGCSAHLVLLSPPVISRRLLERAEQLVRQLEMRWSTFLVDSDVSRANARPGRPTGIGRDAMRLFSAARLGWIETAGAFDPFARIGRPSGEDMCHLELDWDADTVLVPDGAWFDPSGIGKGLAADIVAEQLRREGALAVMVNVGGDLRAIGSVDGLDLPGTRGGWRVDTELRAAATSAPGSFVPVVVPLCLSEGGVATSSTVSAKPSTFGLPHLLDPVTGEFVDACPRSATVIAPEAWRSEVWTKVILAHGHDGLRRAEQQGLAALACDGRSIEVNREMARYLGDPAPVQRAGDLVESEV